MATTVRLVLAFVLVGCGASTPAASTTSEPAGCTPRGTGEPPEGCEIVVGECCYREQADACAAAGCAEGACLLLESYPAQVQCQ